MLDTNSSVPPVTLEYEPETAIRPNIGVLAFVVFAMMTPVFFVLGILFEHFFNWLDGMPTAPDLVRRGLIAAFWGVSMFGWFCLVARAAKFYVTPGGIVAHRWWKEPVVISWPEIVRVQKRWCGIGVRGTHRRAAYLFGLTPAQATTLYAEIVQNTDRFGGRICADHHSAR